MFFIVNKTKERIRLNDIGITLGPRQAVDLDMLVGRNKSENSAHLRAARSHGQIEIRIKDQPRKGPMIANTPPPIEKGQDLDKVKDEIISKVTDTLSQLLAGQKTSVTATANLSEEDLDKISNKILQNLPAQQVVVQKGDKVEEEMDLDEETLTEISARAVNKIVKDTAMKSVKFEEKKQEKPKLNVDELMDML